MNNKVTFDDVCNTNLAIKLHFEEGSYDAFKFNFKVHKKSVKKNDPKIHTYERIARKYFRKDHLIEYMLSNYLDGNTWINSTNDDSYKAWLAKMDKLKYQFSIDMNICFDYCIDHEFTFDDLLKLQKQTVPIIYLYKRGLVSLESIVIIDVLTKFVKDLYKSDIKDPLNILYSDLYMITHYKPFILKRINTIACKIIIINTFTSVTK